MANRSAAQVGAQQTINAAHVIESLAIRTAEQSDTTTSANASLALSSSAATADYNYLSLAATGLATAAKTYADHLADLAQTKADARAQAQRDLTVNQDMPAYQNALDQADQDYDDNLSGYEQTYNTTAGNAISTNIKGQANATKLYADGVALSSKNLAEGQANALSTYEAADAGSYAWLTGQLALLDEGYDLSAAAGLAGMASSLAASFSTASPWAEFYAAQIGALDDWTQTAAPAQKTQREATANAQAGLNDQGNPTGGGEIALYAAERDLSLAGANADYEQSTTLNSLGYTLANSQADASAAQGSAGALGNPLPVLEDATGTTDTFAVAPAPTSDYSQSSAVCNLIYNCYGAPYYGAYGYYGYGYYDYNGLGQGYYDPYYYANPVPTVGTDLPAGFWNVDTEVQSVRLGANDVPAAAGTLSLVEADWLPESSIPGSNGTSFAETLFDTAAEVESILVDLDPRIGEWFAEHARLTHTAAPDRLNYGPAASPSVSTPLATTERDDDQGDVLGAIGTIFVQMAADTPAAQLAISVLTGLIPLALTLAPGDASGAATERPTSEEAEAVVAASVNTTTRVRLGTDGNHAFLRFQQNDVLYGTNATPEELLDALSIGEELRGLYELREQIEHEGDFIARWTSVANWLLGGKEFPHTEERDRQWLKNIEQAADEPWAQVWRADILTRLTTRAALDEHISSLEQEYAELGYDQIQFSLRTSHAGELSYFKPTQAGVAGAIELAQREPGSMGPGGLSRPLVDPIELITGATASRIIAHSAALNAAKFGGSVVIRSPKAVTSTAVLAEAKAATAAVRQVATAARAGSRAIKLDRGMVAETINAQGQKSFKLSGKSFEYFEKISLGSRNVEIVAKTADDLLAALREAEGLRRLAANPNVTKVYGGEAAKEFTRAAAGQKTVDGIGRLAKGGFSLAEGKGGEIRAAIDQFEQTGARLKDMYSQPIKAQTLITKWA